MKSKYIQNIKGKIIRGILLMIVAGYLVTFDVNCRKFVEVSPPNSSLIANTVYTNDTKAIGTVVSIYSDISGSSFAPGGEQSFAIVASLSADEFTDYSLNSPKTEFYTNVISTTNTTNLVLWRSAYQYIYRTNAVLEGLSNTIAVSDATKKLLQGEARFMRAFLHFYLVNLWGDVPYITSTEYRINAVASRAPKATVYQGIIGDLQDAQNLLPNDYVTTERVRPNKWVAKALLARVYLYMQDWVNAETVATEIINNSSMYTLENDLANVFLKSSSEAIWQLIPVLPDYNSSEGFNYILTAAPFNVALSNQLVNAFETGDLRKDNWIGSYTIGAQTYNFPNKYKIKTSSDITEYSTIFRLAELYLIRAEARAQQNKLTGINSAAEDINAIRNRANLLSTSATTQVQILAAIEQERKVELFTEWGHRWLDLKRTNRANSVLGSAKANWQVTDVLYPIPQLEILNDRNLTQNSGY